MNRITKSLKNINWRLFAALLVMGLSPTIYTTVRMFFLGQHPGDTTMANLKEVEAIMGGKGARVQR